MVHTFFITQFCGLSGGFGSRTFAIVYFEHLLRKCAKKAAVTGMGLTLLDLKNSIESKKKPIEKFKKSCLALKDPAKLQTLEKLHLFPS